MIVDVCDVLIVGAGPGGSSAAREAARRGATVVMVERRATIGVPVQCAEYVPAMLLGQIDCGPDCIAQSVRGMKTHIPGEPVQETAAPGYILRRNRFDQHLAESARSEGVDIMMSTRAVALTKDRNVVLKTKAGETRTVRPRVIIGADGPRSTVGRWVGCVNRNLMPAVQLTVPLAAPLQDTEVYFQFAITAGYGWLFPKGSVANIGLGLKRDPKSPVSLRRLLNQFVSQLQDEGKVIGPSIGSTAGWIPAEKVRPAVYDNILLVGDAAGHTHPVTGAGIFAAVTGGTMAGKWATRALGKSDLTLLECYDEEWQDLFGASLQKAYRRRRELETRWEDFPCPVKTGWIAYRDYYDNF
jgi:geranylgeranyl reductase family protein